jgi:RHS repeat-associated protein
MGNVLRLEHGNGAGGFTREFTVAAANNLLRRVQIGDADYDYTFDANGNMRSETTSRHFEWNHSDQMKAFRTQTGGAEPSVHAHYLYDATGQRVKKLVRKQGGQVEVTHYIDGVFEHHRWGGHLQSGENNHVHVMDDKQRVALVRLGAARPNDPGPVIQFHLGDHLGSSNAVVDASGVLTNREEFTPYGQTSFGSFARKRYRFTGMERDEESGFSYHGARYYSPSLARWLSCDPMMPKDGRTLYSYVSNRPVVLFDPTGEDEKDNPTGKATVEQETIHLTDPYEKPFDYSWAKETFNDFVFGGRGPKAEHRHDTLGPNQTKIRKIIEKGHGCAACHITTEAHNKYGRSAINPENNLPWDWAIDMEGYNDWVTASVVARAIVQLGTATGQFQAGYRASTSFAPLNDPTAAVGEEVNAAFAWGRVRSGTMVRFSDEGGPLAGSGPKQGTGNIWYHDNVKIPGAGPGGAKVELRTHSPNPTAPAGSYSRSNYTTQINTPDGLYRLPDGTWKTIPSMTEAERAAVHYPAGN